MGSPFSHPRCFEAPNQARLSLSLSGRTLHLPAVRLLRLQRHDPAAVCHSAVAVCRMGLRCVDERELCPPVNAAFTSLTTLLSHLPPGADRFYENIEDMIGYKPLALIKHCLKYVTPLVCMVSSKHLEQNVPVGNMWRPESGASWRF